LPVKSESRQNGNIQTELLLTEVLRQGKNKPAVQERRQCRYVCRVMQTEEENIVWHNTTIEMFKRKWFPYDLSNVNKENNLLIREIKAVKEFNEHINNRTDADN